VALAYVLRRAGRAREAAAVLREAAEFYDPKGNPVFAARARQTLLELDAS
jgi:hypothetical protein